MRERGKERGKRQNSKRMRERDKGGEKERRQVQIGGLRKREKKTETE